MSKESLSQCSRCKREFPAHLCSTVMPSCDLSAPVCALCALEVINEAHGTHRTEFQGEQAEWMRQECIRYVGRQMKRQKEV